MVKRIHAARPAHPIVAAKLLVDQVVTHGLAEHRVRHFIHECRNACRIILADFVLSKKILDGEIARRRIVRRALNLLDTQSATVMSLAEQVALLQARARSEGLSGRPFDDKELMDDLSGGI